MVIGPGRDFLLRHDVASAAKIMTIAPPEGQRLVGRVARRERSRWAFSLRPRQIGMAARYSLSPMPTPASEPARPGAESSPQRTSLPADLSEFVAARYALLIARCREVGVALYDDAGVSEHLKRVLLVSDFAFESFRREPALLGPDLVALMGDPRGADARRPAWPDDLDEAGAMRALRQYRRREAVRLIWRDVNGLDSVEQTLAGASSLGEACLDLALALVERALRARHGTPRDSRGREQRLVVVAFGKLGGSELNFSSDIDLILAFAENGETDGGRPLANELYFARAGSAAGQAAERDHRRRLSRFASTCACARSATPAALRCRFGAMEQYYQREGRDWERYAWIKARPVAGDNAAGKRLHRTAAPVRVPALLRLHRVCRPARDEGADRRRGRAQGSGRAHQARPGRHSRDRVRRPAPAADPRRPRAGACGDAACWRRSRSANRSVHSAGASAKRLRAAYLFLRHLENRVQMLRDEQTHELPEDAFTRSRLALGLGYAGWPALDGALTTVRDGVTEEYTALIPPARGDGAGGGSQCTPAGLLEGACRPFRRRRRSGRTRLHLGCSAA